MCIQVERRRRSGSGMIGRGWQRGLRAGGISIAGGCGQNLSEAVQRVGLQAAVRREDTVTRLCRVRIGVPGADFGDDTDRYRAIYRRQQLERAFEIALAVSLDVLIRLMDESVESWKPAFGRRANLYDGTAYFGGRNKEAALVDLLLRRDRIREATIEEKVGEPPLVFS